MDFITEEREALLVERSQDGCERSMVELLDAYKPAIEAQARKVEPFYPLDDARQEARMAFINLVYTHDSERARLAQRVKAELANALREASSLQNQTFNIPARTQRRFQSILKRAEYDANAGADMAQENGMGRHTFLTIYNAMYGFETAGEYWEEADSLYGTGIMDMSTAGLVEDALSILTNEEEIVVRAAYGFNQINPLSDYEISKGLINKSTSTVRRIRNRALVKMRQKVCAA